MSETEDGRCGICGGPKSALKQYNTAKFGVQMESVRLCQRCDLTPDPPPIRERGLG